MNDLGFEGVTDLVTRYKQYSGTKKTVSTLRKAYYRGDERVMSGIFEFIVIKNKKRISKEIDDIISANKYFFEKIFFPLMALLIVLFVIKEVIDRSKRPLNEEIKNILKQKGFTQKRFAEWYFSEKNENESDIDTEERREKIRKFTEIVYTNLKDPNRNQETLQDYLDFALTLPSIILDE